jgi:hypothetical protein
LVSWWLAAKHRPSLLDFNTGKAHYYQMAAHIISQKSSANHFCFAKTTVKEIDCRVLELALKISNFYSFWPKKTSSLKALQASIEQLQH